jgi:hypothetical protein
MADRGRPSAGRRPNPKTKGFKQRTFDGPNKLGSKMPPIKPASKDAKAK